MSSVQAMEQICGVEVGGQLRALRRLLYCGEWIESHALHVFMLHLPDFLGYESAIEVARDNPELVSAGARAEEDRQRGDDRRRRPRGASDQRPGRRLVPRAAEARARAARREARARAGDRARGGARHRRPRLPRLRPGLRARRALRAGRVPDRPRTDRLQPRPRHRGRRVRRALRRGARRMVERAPFARARSAARTSAGRWPASRSATSELSPLAREAAARGGCRARRAQPVPEHRRPLGRAGLRGRRGAAPDRRVRGAGRAGGRGRAARRRRLRLHRGAARDPLPPLPDRRRRARSSTRRSCRRRRRTSGRSRRICAGWSSARSTSPTRS